jgi:lipoprotein NlpD
MIAMHLPTLILRAAAALVIATGLAACGTNVPLNQPPSPSLPPVPPAPPVAPVPPPPKPQALFGPPASGATIARFDGNKSKGMDIAGELGDPILASRDGRVVIVSNALKAYGTMIIVKHDETYITAYANIDKALVKENDVVRQGQKIAEMGKSGTDRVKLHFEIRKQGVAVDPEPYLSGKLR